jgi:PAS domain S-box-containing protein
MGSAFDITERKRAEEALRKAELEKSAILDAMSELVIYLDMDMKIIWSNSTMNRQFNMKPGQAEGRYCYEVLHKLNRPCKVCPVVKAIETGNPCIIDDFSSFGKRWTLRAYPVRNEVGNLVGVVEIVTDITERKQAEDELRKALLDLQELNFIVNKSPAIAFLWSPTENWPVEFVSENIAQFGYMPDDLMSGRIPYALIIHRDDLKRIVDEVMRYIQEGRTEYTQEYRIITKSGEVRWIDDRTWIRRNEDGQITHHQGIVVDITERKRLEERLHRAEKMEALGTLAGGVAHDLNNVLGVVVGYSELLLTKIDESNIVRSYAMNVMQGGQRAAAIVQDLLTLARRGVHVEKIVNLNTIINDFQKSPEFERLCSFHPNVRIKTELKLDLLNIKGSPVHLVKTFFNLVSNAAEAMPNGGMVTVTTSNEYLERPIQGYDDVREGDYVVLSISDTGEGIPAADLKRIFEPFYTKKVMGRSGTGLGLAVVWGTVKDHKGYINVHSEEGEGTIFSLYFPVTREVVSKDQISIPMSEYMGNGESILIVDDVKGQRELAAHLLQALNYSTATVSSGEEAIEYLKANKADLIVLDMIMDPGIDGLDTYRGILKINPKQKAIIVSGFSETVRVNQAQALGAGTYVRKPYVMERLGLAVRKELDKP